MFEKGLAYQSFEPINWCPSCKTGLANEDVEDGQCERCGTAVEKKPMRQWVLKITDYAERLLADLDSLSWPKNIKEQQRNWIGKSNGSLIKFPISNFQFSKKEENGEIEVFTTRADTLFGATYLVLAPENPDIGNWKLEIKNWNEVKKYILDAKTRTEIERSDEKREKTGVKLDGVTAINPANGEEISIFVADYVLSDYGTGAIMAVPAHDERDFQFAKKYGLPIKMVICPNYPAPTCLILDQAYLGAGHLVGSGKFDGMESAKAAKVITEFVGGKVVTKYKLRDWVFSRQRYWGEPIPLILCEECKKRVESSKLNAKRSTLTAGETLNPGWIAVPERSLPVKLPKVRFYEPTGTGESPLASIEKWVNVKCPKCGGKARRETNTMPQWAGSSWYHIAYCISENSKSQKPNSKQIPNLNSQSTKQKLRVWLPVDLYVGGAEHATRHLIYARFWHKFLQDIGIVSVPEPFMKLRPVGLIMGEDGRKMSKRFGNVINPDDIVERFGADSLRVYEMFMGPFAQAINWSTDGMVGAKRFLERVWKIAYKLQAPSTKSQTNSKFQILINQTTKKVTEDIETMRFNTAISALMILTNEMDKLEKVAEADFKILLRLLAPFAPHIAEELWRELGGKKSIHLAPWPKYDPAKAQGALAKIVIQVNGKTRGSMEIGRNLSQTEVEKQTAALPEIAKWLAGQFVKKIIFVPKRLINFVVA